MKFSLRLFYILLIFGSIKMHGQVILHANEGSIGGDSTKLYIAMANLEEGTRIWGLVIKDTNDSIQINDFNVGPISIYKEQLKNLHLALVESNVIIETVNETSYFGVIKKLEQGWLTLNSSILGDFRIQANTISKITFSESFVSRRGSTWFTNPNVTRYFFAPSAIPLKKNEGYYQNAYLLANSVNVGLTDNITIGGGIVIPLLFYVTPKASFRAAKNFYLGGGVLFTQSFISGFDLSAGIGYGLCTYGSYEHNLTLGAGYGYAKFNNEYLNTPMPIVTLNGMTRVGKKFLLVSENWLIPRAGFNKEITSLGKNGEEIIETVYEKKQFYSGALSLGLRFMPGIRTSVDFSMVGIRTNPGQNDLILPYLDFVYKFD